MGIIKQEDGRYLVDLRPKGISGRRIRRIFQRKSEAVAFQRHVQAHAESLEWAGGPSDRRLLSGLLDAWWLLHGQTMENGATERRHLQKTVRHLGNLPVNRLNRKMLAAHRSDRLAAGISAATINRDLYRLSGVFSTLIRLGELRCGNPCKGLTPLQERPPAMTYLSRQEIAALLQTMNGDDRRVALLCLSTGARWSEASTLHAGQVINGRVTFLKTKNGKKRTVPVSPAVEREIKTCESGPLFSVDYERFCRKLREVKPDLPRGQATHVLRHTFASWFMMNGGNILALQRIMGHASVRQTMAYAHLAPDFLQEAITLNPVAQEVGP
ncbi:phage integrase [Pantoea stewartii]|uniref:Integrase n=1 Tax=Pantoea stewartii subsp. stewartii DC283 TaxID=660596 RepID=H3RA30_PANSE|nr:tyrosine-type recombinase/integrase [Pantoea stewartii]ARF52013.1 integrase [Pantoea stewartii subsp. stewartii DC283]EHU02043.1 site-specific recombinase, phage integrase family [Pantoea stewartii subsp. stewartii DC283]KAB0559716.1 tyrosine-type recombinase/integrase [Pantoea stewartii subsp. stewartii]